jgi:hypothetical protein
MDVSQLTRIIESHGLAIDDWHGGAGSFRDLYIGTGKPIDALLRAKTDLASHKVRSHIGTVTNREHPDHGKAMLEIPSFWWA